MDVEAEVKKFRNNIDSLKREISKVIVGHTEVINQVIITMLTGGHALLEGVPGIGKTLLVKTISQCLNLQFSRIQFTPDLMPADIIGTNVINLATSGEKVFEFRKGPIFGNIILADEINRATPKTQSALLEAMQERKVTVADKTHPLPEPFFILATQNPIEMEGTFPLPEAQLDRFFFKIQIGQSNLKELMEIADRTTGNKEVNTQVAFDGQEMLRMKHLILEVPIASHVSEYASRIVLATHPDLDKAIDIVKKYVRYGSSPRGVQALVLASKMLALMKGRYNVSFSDIREVAYPALRHRLILNFEGEAEGIKPETIISQVIEKVPELAEKL